MHEAARTYIREAVAKYVGDPEGLSVLEFGSYNVNGTVRDYFHGADFFGIDTRDGPDVDFVCDAADFDGEGRYDVVVSTETLEHAKHPDRIIARAWDSLKPGGLLILTAAAPERPAHNCDGNPDVSGEHYAGIHPGEVRHWLTCCWEIIDLTHDPKAGDIYAVARKSNA